MALRNLLAAGGALPLSTFSSKTTPKNSITSRFLPCPAIKCITLTEENPIVRRSANYQAPIWDHNYIQSLTSDFLGESHVERASKLKADVKMLLIDKTLSTHEQLELIDTLQRLGLSYHFQHDIKRIINAVYKKIGHHQHQLGGISLYAAALQYRILRQHGYFIHQDIFLRFQDKRGKFDECLRDDIKGILSLYEASFLMVGGENIMEDARDFATKCLKLFVNEYQTEHEDIIILYELVSHALELPLHWRMLRLEARWFIDVYERSQDTNQTLLEFAKLDFNMVQAIHQQDLQYSSRWWESTGFGESMKFARDRIMENFLWTVGMSYEPQYGLFRRLETKIYALITTIDDVYDVYGSVDELELLTRAFHRWDINEAEKLPQYMKLPFLSFYNSTNEAVVKALTEQGLFVLPCLKKYSANLFQCYLRESKWFHDGYKPTMEEYKNMAWMSIGAPLVLLHSYFALSCTLNDDVLEDLAAYPDILRYSSLIVRLADDLGTSSEELKRGDNPKSIQCYMNDTGASEEDARKHIRALISETWTKLNEEKLGGSTLSPVFVDSCINIARQAQCMYLYGDGHASQDAETQNRMESLFINPIF